MGPAALQNSGAFDHGPLAHNALAAAADIRRGRLPWEIKDTCIHKKYQNFLLDNLISMKYNVNNN